MATAIEQNGAEAGVVLPVEEMRAGLTDCMLCLCRCVDFISGDTTPTFLANPAKQEECFARARRAVGQCPGHWDIQWRDEAMAGGWSRTGLSFTVANGRSPASVIEAAPVNPPKSCPRCEARQRYNRSSCEAVAKLKHAGLEYLATEMDWVQAAKQYGGPPSELIQFVEALAAESDYDAVQVLVNRFYAEPRSSFSDERV